MRGLAEVPHCVGEVLTLPCQLTENIFRSGISRVDLQFLLQLLLRLILEVGSRIRPRKQQSRQPKVNTGILRVFREDLTIVLFRLVPFTLQLVCLRIHLERRNGSRLRLRKLPCGIGGEIGVGVHRHIQHLRIVREVLVQHSQQIQQRLLLLEKIRAAHPVQAGSLL